MRNSKLFDPERSAVAVRELLDKAEGALRVAGPPLLFPGDRSSQHVHKLG